MGQTVELHQWRRTGQHESTTTSCNQGYQLGATVVPREWRRVWLPILVLCRMRAQHGRHKGVQYVCCRHRHVQARRCCSRSVTYYSTSTRSSRVFIGIVSLSPEHSDPIHKTMCEFDPVFVPCCPTHDASLSSVCIHCAIHLRFLPPMS